MLPAGWAEFKDPTSGNPYYHCAATSETTWTRPTLPLGAAGIGAAPMGAPAVDLSQQQWQQPAVQPQQQPQQFQDFSQQQFQQPAQLQPQPQYQQPQQQPQQMAGAGFDCNAADISAMINQAAAGVGGVQAGAPNGAGGTRISGIVKTWNEEKGFGFIDPVGGGDNVFVHRSCLQDGNMLEKGNSVQYDLTWNDQKGKHQASNCTGASGAVGGKGGGGFGGAPAFMGAPMGSPMGVPMGAPAGAPAMFGAPPSGEQVSGTVKIWFEDKGFGFITPSDGSNDCYVHRTFLQDGGTLVVGSTVQYALEWNAAKNKYSATRVTGAAPGPSGGKGGAPGGMAPMPSFGAAMPVQSFGPAMPGMGAPMPMAMPGMDDANRYSPYSGGPAPFAAAAAPAFMGQMS